MRREELFSRSGFYGFLLKSNVLLHREAARAAVDAFQPVVAGYGRGPVAILDLACGGWPVTVAEAMAAFPGAAFRYTGVDINPWGLSLAVDLTGGSAPSNLFGNKCWKLSSIRSTSNHDWPCDLVR